jgi:hypothetical protein
MYSSKAFVTFRGKPTSVVEFPTARVNGVMPVHSRLSTTVPLSASASRRRAPTFCGSFGRRVYR